MQFADGSYQLESGVARTRAAAQADQPCSSEVRPKRATDFSCLDVLLRGQDLDPGEKNSNASGALQPSPLNNSFVDQLL
jgi:hypothetical protein